MEISRQEFELLREYIHRIAGISISDDKVYLIRQRLEPLVQTYGCTSFGEFYQMISQSRLPIYQEQIINAITTNETAFFRDAHPFTAFEEYILPELGKIIRERKARQPQRKGSKVRCWSAGSSTGQEPYSIAMLIHEYASANRHLFVSTEDFGILATDISSQVLAKSISGIYTDMEMQRGLSQERMEKYFRKEGAVGIIQDAIRSMVEFRQINLTQPFTLLGGFDVIFCRNVLIYFDHNTKSRIVDQFFHMLSDGGYLILGATESIYAITDRFESVRHGKSIFYQKPVA